MTIKQAELSSVGAKTSEDIGTWQELFVPTSTERVQRAKQRVLRPMEICLERARAEMSAYERYQTEPRVLQRARVFETYLQTKTIFILDNELIVGNLTSKIRGASFSSEMTRFMKQELGHPTKDFEIRPHEKILITEAERTELRETLLPYFEGKTLGDYILNIADPEMKQKAFSVTAPCPHIPVIADLSLDKDLGHQMANYEKVLHKGLYGIREELEWYKSRLDHPSAHYGLKEKRNFYEAATIALDAAIAHGQRYAKLAREKAFQEVNPRRQEELKEIARICERVPAYPARTWWEALQSVWFTHLFIHCDLYNIANSLGRFDQYMYYFYNQSVNVEKSISREKALELLESFWVKLNEWAILLSYDVATYQPGQALSQTITIGGQTREGKDACNEMTQVCLEAEEQVGLPQPEIAMRLWDGTSTAYLKKAAEVIRLGRGKPKFIADRKAIQMMAKAYPDLTVEDWRECAVMGCTELCLPHISMQHSWEGICITPKLLELALNNGRCPLCGEQTGPLTGDPRSFTSISALRQAYQTQLMFWMEHMAKGIKLIKEAQAVRVMAPFCSTLSEGPLEKGIDLAQGGAWYSLFGVYLTGLANTADSFAVIDKLIYHDKQVTWDQLLSALKDNWKGAESLRQLCINGVPKYGNDNDYADDWANWVMDTWYDAVDWINSQKNLVPSYGGTYVGAGIIGQSNVTFGPWVGALPDGHQGGTPLADCISPSPGVDKKGPTAVIRSASKLPTHRFALGGVLNLRLSPQLVATDRDVDNYVAFLRALEELGVYHTQFNVVSSSHLRKAMQDPEQYRDLLVRVASYCTYFVELTEEQQLDIINRSEQQGW